MASTVPDNILTPDAGDQYALVQDLGIMADSIQDALSLRGNALKGTAAERAGMSSPQAGMIWADTDGIQMIWRYNGSAWVPAIWRWAGTTTQMNSFSPPDGFEWFNTTDNSEYVRSGGAWGGIFAAYSNYTGASIIGSAIYNQVSLTGMPQGRKLRVSWGPISCYAPSTTGVHLMAIVYNTTGSPVTTSSTTLYNIRQYFQATSAVIHAASGSLIVDVPSSGSYSVGIAGAPPVALYGADQSQISLEVI